MERDLITYIVNIKKWKGSNMTKTRRGPQAASCSGLVAAYLVLSVTYTQLGVQSDWVRRNAPQVN
jgi:hypothetical protein